jgi:hypothetical protein
MTVYTGANVQFTIGGTQYTYNLNGSNSTGNLWAVQNVTPTFVQAKAGSSVDNEVQPFAETAYSDWTGSLGLYERTDDPGDFSRPFFSTLDHSKPRQLTPAAFIGNGLSAINTNSIDTAGTLFAWVDSTAGPGFVAKKSGSATYGYWLWNEATFSWDYQRDVYNTPNVAVAGGNPAVRGITGFMHKPFQTVVQYGTSLYMATTGGTPGLTDISIAAAAPSGAQVITACVYTVKFFDQLVTFALNGGNINIVALSGAPLTVTQSIAADGSKFNNTCTIYGETCIMGVVAWRGVLYLFTDRSLYTLQWIEATNVFDVMPQIVGNAKFTSNPVVFASELWIGSDNQLWHLQAGATNNDFKLIDADGWLPSPFNGRITELHPFMQVLVAKVVDLAGGAALNNTAMLRYTSLGSWQFLTAYPSTTTVSQMTAPAMKTQDGTNYPTIHLFHQAGFTTRWAVFESGQNVRSLTPGTIAGAPGIHVTPWEYGQNRTSQKQLLRSRWEVEYASSTGGSGGTSQIGPCYYQTDQNNRAANSPSFTSISLGATNLGAWVAATPAMGTGTTGDAGSALDVSGSGVLWTEYDGSNGSDWHGSVAYPTFKRVRFLYNFPNGAGGSVYPALLSHSWQRLEYAFKFYVINTMLKLECNLDQPNSPGLYSTPNQLVAAVQVLQAADYGKAIITAVGPDAQSYTCVISKFLSNYTILDPDGPKQAIVQLTLQSVKLYGLAI